MELIKFTMLNAEKATLESNHRAEMRDMNKKYLSFLNKEKVKEIIEGRYSFAKRGKYEIDFFYLWAKVKYLTFLIDQGDKTPHIFSESGCQYKPERWEDFSNFIKKEYEKTNLIQQISDCILEDMEELAEFPITGNPTDRYGFNISGYTFSSDNCDCAIEQITYIKDVFVPLVVTFEEELSKYEDFAIKVIDEI